MSDNKFAEQGESGWRPIETAPRDGTHVDLWHRCGFRSVNCNWYFWSDSMVGWMNNEGDYDSDEEFTHWMPMPEPPK